MDDGCTMESFEGIYPPNDQPDCSGSGVPVEYTSKAAIEHALRGVPGLVEAQITIGPGRIQIVFDGYIHARQVRAAVQPHVAAGIELRVEHVNGAGVEARTQPGRHESWGESVLARLPCDLEWLYPPDLADRIAALRAAWNGRPPIGKCFACDSENADNLVDGRPACERCASAIRKSPGNVTRGPDGLVFGSATVSSPAGCVLDDVIDGVTLRELIDWGAKRRSYEAQRIRVVVSPGWLVRQGGKLLPSQRAAVSAHWSAQLRAKVASSTAADRERERTRVVLEQDADDLPWRTW